MLTDYKFWYIKRDDDIHISEAAVRFFEGNVVNRQILDFATEQIKTVSRYERTTQLDPKTLPYLAANETKTELANDVVVGDAVIFTPADFGVISTDDELRAFCDQQLAKDTKRIPVEMQKVSVDIK